VTALDRRRIDLFTVMLNPISLDARENSSVPIRSDRSTSPCLTRRRLALALTSIILASPLIRMAHLATGKPGFAKSSFTIFRSTESAKTKRANTGSDGRCRTAYYLLSFIYRTGSFQRNINSSLNKYIFQRDIRLSNRYFPLFRRLYRPKWNIDSFAAENARIRFETEAICEAIKLAAV